MAGRLFADWWFKWRLRQAARRLARRLRREGHHYPELTAFIEVRRILKERSLTSAKGADDGG